MATNEEDQLNNNEEPKIPVFTVLKNGAILKNIFIVNNKSPPPPFSLSNLPRTIKFVQESENPNDQENEEVLTVGRHPDCNIMLTHPSISRFHLQIVSNSSLQKLSVVDLSSVHGSWVSEKRIEPWVRTELEEGDTLKIGGSSRVYKLHWIPLSQAYDFENPYVSLSDVSMNEEKREENLVTEKENVAEVYQDEIYIQMEDKCTQEIESLEVVETKKEDKGEYEGSYSLLVEDIEMQHLAVENINSISSDENLGLIVKEGVPSAPLMPESPIYALFDENEEDSDSLLKEFGEQNVNSKSSDENLGLIVKEGVPSAPLMPESPIYALFDENEEDSDSLLKEFGEQNVNSISSDENLGLIVKEGVPSAPLMPESPIYALFDENEEDNDSLLKEFGEQNVNSSDENLELIVKEGVPSASLMPESPIYALFDENEEDSDSLLKEFGEQNVNSISSDENLGLIVKEGVPSAPLMPESPIYALFDENEEDSDSLLKEFGEQNVNSKSSDENLGLIVKEGVPSAPLMPESPIYALFDENEEDSDSLLKEFGEQNEAWSICTGPSEIRSVNFNLPAEEEYISETWSLEFDKENECLQPHFATDMDPEIRGVEENESNLFMDLGSYSIEKEEGNCAGECILETESPECGVGNHFLQSHSVADMVSEIREATSRTENESNLIKNLDSLSLIEQKVVDQCAAKLAVPSGGESLNSLLSIEEYISEAPSPDCEVCEAELPEGENTSNHVNFNPLYSIELKEEVDCASEPIGDLFSPVIEALEESEAQKVDKENQSPEPFKVLQYLSQGAKQDNTLLEEKLCSSFNFNSVVTYEGGHPAAENHKGREDENILRFMAEYVNSGITDDKGSHAPQSLLVELRKTEETKRSLVKSDTTSSFHNIWSRRGKPGNVLHIQTDKSKRNTVEAGLDMELKQCNEEDAEEKSNFNENFSSLDVEDVEIFTPDKENLTPNTLLRKSLKKKGKLKEVKNSKTSKSSSAKVTFNHNIHFKEDFTASCGKETRTSKVLQEQMCHLEKRKPFGDLAMDEQGKKKRPERVPFQSLIANAAVKSRSDIFGYSAKFHQTSKKNNVVQEKNNKSWTMVVDTASLLNKDSRKSLQLLQGLKGTLLIIPRMVIRELDCLKRKGSLFKRKTKASFVLEWIEECLVKTSWWIHVQSSGEDRRLTAATPPASPQSLCPTNIGHFCYETTTNSLAFSSQRSSSEILSPTAEDHILDCALLYRKMKRDGQLVLLSNDVTLKIKAMAEGLLCETVQEFRESLVNPFSERFLWADSSPRGLTWSYLDDAMLREKYNNHCPSRKSSNAESAKGLKLILLHNSHHRQITPTS